MYRSKGHRLADLARSGFRLDIRCVLVCPGISPLADRCSAIWEQLCGVWSFEQYKQARIVDVSPATVNPEVTLLKHMFNLAETWGAFRGTNRVRMVKFFDEDNDVVHVLSLEEKGRLLSHCSPYLQDLILFAINTGLRAGDILNLTWEEVDLETSVIIRRTASGSKSR